MRLPFMETVEREQRVAFVSLIIRRLADMGALSDEVKARKPTELARDVVGLTDMESVERWTAVNAAISITSRAASAAAIVGADVVSPALHGLADAVSRLSERGRPTSRSTFAIEPHFLEAEEGGAPVAENQA